MIFLVHKKENNEVCDCPEMLIIIFYTYMYVAYEFWVFKYLCVKSALKKIEWFYLVCFYHYK